MYRETLHIFDDHTWNKYSFLIRFLCFRNKRAKVWICGDFAERLCIFCCGWLMLCWVRECAHQKLFKGLKSEDPIQVCPLIHFISVVMFSGFISNICLRHLCWWKFFFCTLTCLWLCLLQCIFPFLENEELNRLNPTGIV